jgi:hypothetical protein
VLEPLKLDPGEEDWAEEGKRGRGEEGKRGREEEGRRTHAGEYGHDQCITLHITTTL